MAASGNIQSTVGDAASCEARDTVSTVDHRNKSLLRRVFSTVFLRFAGWWSIFAGLLALNSVCPMCGSTACPLGIGATGLIAGIAAALKMYGLTAVRGLISTITRAKGVRVVGCGAHGPGCGCTHHHAAKRGGKPG